MNMKQMGQRLLNELPTIAAGIAAVVYVFGFEVPDDVWADLVEHVEAVLAFGLWLYARQQVDGPVTRHDLHAHGNGHAGEGDQE